MTTTRPRPPSVDTFIEAETPAPLPPSEALYYITGPAGAGASGTGAATERPSPVAKSLADLEPFIGTNGPTHTAVEAIFDQVETNVSVALLPPGATQAQMVSTLEKVRFLTDSPTHLYAPGQTQRGTALGILSSNVAINAAGLELAANAASAVSVNDLLRVGDEIVRVTAAADQHTFTVERALHGTAAVAHAAGTSVSNMHSPVCAELALLIDELECVAVADAPAISVEAARQWAAAGNVGPDLMGVFNRGDNKWPGGFWLGAVASVAAEKGRAQGIEHARVKGIGTLEHNLSHSPRGTVETDVSNLVGSYLSTLVRRRGHIEIVGHTFAGVTDVRRFWSVSLVVQHMRRLAEQTAEPFIGDDTTQDVLVDLAGKVSRRCAN